MSNGLDPNQLIRAIDASLAERAEKIYEEIKEEMVKRLERDKAEIITKTVIYLSTQLDYQTMTDRVIITIRKDATNEPK